MLINTPEERRIVDDYDILFTSGFMMPLTIDKAKGDEIEFPKDTGAIVIKLAPKPSQTNPDKILPAEDITVFPSHIISIQHRVREIIELSPEQKTSYSKTWESLATPKNIM